MRFFLLLLVTAALLFLTPSPKAATLVWDQNSEPDLAGYLVYIQSPSATHVGDAGLKNYYPLTNLVNGVTYQIYVTAYATNGIESEPSETLPYTPLPGVPPQLVIIGNFVQREGTNWVINLNWNPAPSSYMVQKYQLRVLHGNAAFSAYETTATGAKLKVPIFSPTIVHLWAENQMGSSSSTVIPYIQPAAPTGVHPVISSSAQ